MNLSFHIKGILYSLSLSSILLVLSIVRLNDLKV